MTTLSLIAYWEKGEEEAIQMSGPWDLVEALMPPVLRWSLSFPMTCQGADAISTPILWAGTHMAKNLKATAQSTQVVQGMGRQVFLQDGPHFPITHPSFRRMKKQSPMEVYFKPSPSGILQMHGTAVSERLVNSLPLPTG